MKTYEAVVLDAANSMFSSEMSGSYTSNSNSEIIASIFEMSEKKVYTDIEAKFKEIKAEFYAANEAWLFPNGRPEPTPVSTKKRRKSKLSLEIFGDAK